MKVLVTILVITFSVGWAMAQAPLAIPFQGAVRNANNVLIGNKTISVRFSIHNGFSFGNIIYREWQTTVTNTQGLFVLNVGQGNAEIGQFSSINWSDSTKFMQVEIDTTNSKSVWRDIGTQQMLSVPYALSARKADSASIAVKAKSADSAKIAAFAVNGVPAGSVLSTASNNIPIGYLLCNGQALDTTLYSNLFTAIGYTYGGSGSSFNLPDYRGTFLRGLDNGRGYDVGRAIGTYQTDAFGAHSHHEFGGDGYSSGLSNNNVPAISSTDVDGNIRRVTGYTLDREATLGKSSTEGDTETRPKNYSVNYIIKY